MNEALEAFPEVAAVLREAGWKPHPEWRLYTKDTRVAGITPDGTSLNVKNWAQIQPGDPRYSADTPDTANEAAAWLVAWHNARAAVLTTPATLDIPLAPSPEAEETLGHEGDGETGEEAGSADAPAEDEAHDVRPAPEPYLADDAAAGSAGGDEGATWTAGVQPDLLDADFTDDSHISSVREQLEALPELGQELAEEHPEEFTGQSRFYGLDDLDRRRNLRIGDVMVAALNRMRRWDREDDASLAELRNFAMGVSEGRWADDDRKQSALAELEARLRLNRDIEAERDRKVAFLVTATREEVDAFNAEDWA